MKLALALSALLLLFGCVTPPRVQTYGLDPASAALVRQTCVDIMGVRPGLAEFDACGASLADSLRSRNHARRLGEAHETCEQQGLAEGTAALARCVLASLSAAAPANAPASGMVPATARETTDRQDVPRILFYNMSRPLQHEREKLACAELGLDPIGAEFGDCVTGLRLAFFDLENPL